MGQTSLECSSVNCSQFYRPSVALVFPMGGLTTMDSYIEQLINPSISLSFLKKFYIFGSVGSFKIIADLSGSFHTPLVVLL
jgi:hypothetical protein